MRIEYGGRVRDKSLKIGTAAEIRHSLCGHIGRLEDDVIEDDDEKVAFGWGGLIDDEDVEGEGDGVMDR